MLVSWMSYQIYSVEENKPFLGDFTNDMDRNDRRLETYQLISLRLDMMIDTTELYI